MPSKRFKLHEKDKNLYYKPINHHNIYLFIDIKYTYYQINNKKIPTLIDVAQGFRADSLVL